MRSGCSGFFLGFGFLTFRRLALRGLAFRALPFPRPIFRALALRRLPLRRRAFRRLSFGRARFFFRFCLRFWGRFFFFFFFFAITPPGAPVSGALAAPIVSELWGEGCVFLLPSRARDEQAGAEPACPPCLRQAGRGGRAKNLIPSPSPPPGRPCPTQPG